MTVPRGLPPSQAERLHTMLTRMAPGAAGGQTRHIGRVGRFNDRAPQYTPFAGGSFLPPRYARWGDTPTITTSYSFTFDDANLTSIGDQSWHSLSAGWLHLADNGCYAVCGYAVTSSASLTTVDQQWNSAPAQAGPDQRLQFVTVAYSGTFYGCWSQTYVTGPGSDFRFSVGMSGGGASTVEVSVLKIG